MGIEVEQGNFLAIGEDGLFSRDRLQDAAGDRMIAPHRHRPGSGPVKSLIEIRHALNRRFIVIGLR